MTDFVSGRFGYARLCNVSGCFEVGSDCFCLFQIDFSCFGTLWAVFKFCWCAVRCVKVCSKLRLVVSACFRMLEDVRFVLVVSKLSLFVQVVLHSSQLFPFS